MGTSQFNISEPTPLREGPFSNGYASSGSDQFSGMNSTESLLISNIQSNRGQFKGEVQWCSNLSLDDWKTHFLQIDERGALCHALNEEGIADLRVVTEKPASSNKPILKHLQSCKVQLLDSSMGNLSVIKVETYYSTIYLRATEKKTFLSLFSALIFWKSLKDRGIFNKISVIQPIFSRQQKPIDLLVCQFNIYGPIPRNKNVPLKSGLATPPPIAGVSVIDEMGWYSAMGRLSSDGRLDLLLQSDGSVLWSLDISSLLRSEIRILDPSLFQNDNFLFLGVVRRLRDQLKISSNIPFYSSTTKTQVNSQAIYLQFPLRIDLEDWFVALNTFAQVESVSLLGTDKSNELRISNRFKVSILEADFSGINLMSYDHERHQEILPRLYSDISIWDHCWARTSIVTDAQTPFWREEFDFNFSVKTSPVCVAVKIALGDDGEYSSSDKTLGVIEITQEMINDGSLSAETRIPLFDAENKHFQLGTLCIKVASSLNAILPSVNFTKLDSMLSRMSLTKMTEYLNDISIADYLKLEDLSVVFLDIFQALNRTNDWFQALIEKEFSNIDNSISKNTNKNLSSANIYSSLFRGNSILTKSIERYFNRIGQEYLDKAIGGTIRKVVSSDMCLELDPSRIREIDAQRKSEILEGNYSRLLKVAEELWSRISSTSNDLPIGIKEQLKAFRKNLEIICKNDELKSTLNCISGFLFLRFFCPVILNPKLFHIVENHPEEGPKRTLTLLTKIILNLSTLTLFGKKEPWMTKMNEFILKHEGELTDYIDKVTDKKLDFSPKALKLSNSVARPRVALNESCLNDLPTNPYLIDRYLRETELISVLTIFRRDEEKSMTVPKTVSMNRLSKEPSSSFPSPIIDQTKATIGELEFEKLTENNAEVFGEDLMKYLNIDKANDNVGSESPTVAGFTIEEKDLTKTLEQESLLLYHRLEHLTNVLSNYEYPNEIILGKTEFALFLVDNLYMDRNNIVELDLSGSFAKQNGLSKLCSDSSLFMKDSDRHQSPPNSGQISRARTVSQRPNLGFSSSKSNPLSKKKGKQSENKSDNKQGFKLLRFFRK
ncbi:GTPase-activating protein BUD2 [Lachancea thermotolerans CBS 6340]|uniref:KLTH0D05808p n=1 Tax=Lachancea thermotolerans (strain ATCC 56472 / CBS 6340 / NRRL Y-8284) TaxID=559295 RepID=C5DGJ5_LACTC|nr:KLTH0D05808p [Lachancea thermotolerans CBS 6340]CAR22537.1 KLTH0D05808p [Lachancea thermotolerans CBS 6340]